jgi:hypothetical protein
MHKGKGKREKFPEKSGQGSGTGLMGMHNINFTLFKGRKKPKPVPRINFLPRREGKHPHLSGYCPLQGGTGQASQK